MASAVEKIRDGLDLLGGEFGFDLKLDDEDTCAFDFGDGLICTIEFLEDSQALYLWSQLMTVAETERDTLFAKAMAINANPFQTGGAALGFDANGGDLLLSFLCPCNRLGPADIANTIATFMLISTDLLAQFQNDNSADPAHSAEPPDNPGPDNPGDEYIRV